MFPERLTKGYRAFLDGRFKEERSRFATLADSGQSPSIMVFGCVDSRVSPEVIFDAAPGEILVARNVANLVPRYDPSGGQHGASAALEFAVQSLKVEHIIVMGHALCGGIKALMNQPREGDFVKAWMNIAATARETALNTTSTPEAAQRCCEHEAVKISLENLLTFPWIKTAVDAGKLQTHGWHFDLETATLYILDKATGTFKAVA